MSTRKAWLLTIRLQKGRWRLLLPLSLAVLEETVVAVNDMVGLVSPLIRLPQGVRITDPLNLIRAIINSIRKYPHLRLVQVEADEIKIGVNLY